LQTEAAMKSYRDKTVNEFKAFQDRISLLEKQAGNQNKQNEAQV